MRTHQKAFLGFASLVTALTMAACGSQAPSDVQGKYAPPTEEMLKLKSCVAEKLGDLHTVVAPEISVCRKTEAGEIKPSAIQPNFYVGANKGKVRIVQVVSVRLSYAGLEAGVSPSPEIKGKSEQALRAFLLGKCEPMLKDVMKRSGLHARYVFQTYQSEESFAGVDSALESPEAIFGDSTQTLAVQPPVADSKTGTDPKAAKNPSTAAPTDSKPAAETAKVDSMQTVATMPVRPKTRTRGLRQSPNFVLELLLGADQGVTIKDHPHPVSSGPLASDDAKAANVAFCTQLAVRLGEHMGLGGLEKGQSCDAAAGASDLAAKVALAKAGLMKADSVQGGDASRLKLSKSEVFSVMKPICGDLENASKASEKSLK